MINRLTKLTFAGVLFIVSLSLVTFLGFSTDTLGQVIYRSGEDISPAFDGWEENPDGTFNLVFGYFYRTSANL